MVLDKIREAGKYHVPEAKSFAPVGNAEASEPKINLENRVTDMIHEIGIPAHIKGYHYLRDAILMAIEDMDVLNAVTKYYIRLLQRCIRRRQAVWNVHPSPN